MPTVLFCFSVLTADYSNLVETVKTYKEIKYIDKKVRISNENGL